jgi:hypothetical protein
MVIHNLDEYRLAKMVAKDYPKALKNIDKSLEMLYNYKNYVDVAMCINQLYDSKHMMEITLNVCKHVLKNNGRTNV